ncbi:interferon-induced very large GTPase 1-like [Paramormyrops kingsleyae]|uniref:interferon-induced very large GTPase 1-like n=1 Tax=Paramormyrops kingsleyae TaxID=1676925 RepID=UPI003B972946
MLGHPEQYMVTWDIKRRKKHLKVKDRSVTIENLSPGRKHIFSVVTIGTDGSQSECAFARVCTEPSPPVSLKAEEVRSTSVTLCWQRPAGMEDLSYQYIVTYGCDGEQQKSVELESSADTVILRDLKPGTEYSFIIGTVLQTGSRSREKSICVSTKTLQGELIYDLGLESYLQEKLTLSTVLEIISETVNDKSVQSVKSVPWYFLRKLMMVNVTARSGMCTSNEDTELQSLDSFPEDLGDLQGHSNKVNPLDVITALFLCSDGFLQQEMTLKMSMCQYAVPLLLPNSDGHQCMLMLWAMRDIVKKFRPHSLKDPKGFVEDSIVLTKMPMVSFVRLGSSSLRKSHILNQVLSNPQQYHDTFVHNNMACGDTKRRTSNGLVEISWYLPCGNENIDVFPEPVAVSNLRGDISSFHTEFLFLCQTSAAVFVFCDDFGHDCEVLCDQRIRSQLFLVSNSQASSFNVANFKAQISKPQLQPKSILIKHSGMNDAEFVNKLRMTVSKLLKENSHNMNIVDMSAIAQDLGITVDEDCTKCQNGKKMADNITSGITDIPDFKEKQLPLQGEIWKELTKLEKEECRLTKAGDRDIEMYKSELVEKKQNLRKQQVALNMSAAMSHFIKAISNSKEDRPYFLKWMRINLDTISREHLSHLREKYKEKFLNSPEDKELIAKLDRQISSSSLGVEHFLREMGQLYESASSLPENDPARQQMQKLPRLCAELLLDGFPLELVDGDASNIPLRWVSAVMNNLNHLTGSKSKIRVVTVLGVQSTGKSTLLNTMFGVQFAVSSGRCTRGAFMLLIRVKEDFREQLGCDYVMIIDTEGLKSPELAQLAESYEHDNELATLVVGLSDITVINIAMENSTEMKDILQIVVHAFLRMKEVGKKPCCQFVHQNVADVSAHDKNLRDRKLLLEQLNEMTQTVAKMEKRGSNKTFTDIMEYNPEKNNWYIPGLWHGNPPMAPVNAGYSESVSDFKKSLITSFNECRTPTHTFAEFFEWTKSLWNTVKYENFIFSFRNSLVADAYSKLCIEFNKWEWAYRKHMYSWLSQAETKVSNYGEVETGTSLTAEDLLSELKTELAEELTKQEKIILDNISEYYKRKENHIYLVEKYREDFVNSAKTLTREIQNSMRNKIEAAMEIKKGMLKLDTVRKKQTDTMERKVLELIDRCREIKTEMSSEQLLLEFEKMWDDTVKELSFAGLQRRDIGQDIHRQLRANLKRKGSHVNEILLNVNLYDCGKGPFKVQNDGGFLKMVYKHVFRDEQKQKAQELADLIIWKNQEFINEKVKTKSDYHDTYTTQLLRLIDDTLESEKDLQLSDKFEVSVKIHICGFAAREFQEMHNCFIGVNDPRRCLEEFKDQYGSDFKDLFYKTDQCQKKAEEFATYCLGPAIKEYAAKSVGPDIVDEMLTGEKSMDFSTRSFFQFSVLKDLLLKNDFKYFLQYTQQYEKFVKDWILEKIVEYFSKNHNRLCDLVVGHQTKIIRKIIETVEDETSARGGNSGNICQFIQEICTKLEKELVIPKAALDKFMALNKADPMDFSRCLISIMEEMAEKLRAEFEQQKDVESVLTDLPFKPENELFRRVFGCGKQCPFCKTPCEAGGKDHPEHFASIHRPQGTGRYRWSDSTKLIADVCSSCIASEMQFRCADTSGNFHPYKDYRKFFPDWLIQPDTSIEASDYWKYVFATFNDQFAKEFNAEPADIPESWKLIDKNEALKSLEEAYRMIIE